MPLRTAVLQLPSTSYENRTGRSAFVQLSRNWDNEEKREAGGQRGFSVGLAARRDVASQPDVALKKAARSWEAPMR